MSKEIYVQSVSPKRQKALHHTIDVANLAKVNPGVQGNVPYKNSPYAYDNKAYTGSVHSYSNASIATTEPPTSVVREQYWACTRWPKGQKFLAIAVGVLVGAVIGLSLSMTLSATGNNALESLFRTRTAPD